MRHDEQSTASCAPGRALRRSATLGRATCLTRGEEAKLAAQSRGGSSLEAPAGFSDRVLGDRIGAKDVLRPRVPAEWASQPRAWLSNHDIDAVLEQYARIVPNFTYLSTWPTDFAERVKSPGDGSRAGVAGRCVRMCDPNALTRAMRERSLAAAVVNLDVHTGGGTHWVAFAFDCRSGGTPIASFYDPTGRRPPLRWMRNGAWAMIAAAAPDRATRMQILRSARYNTEVHQRKNSECGVFALMLIDALIAGRSFEQHCALATSDDDAFRRRPVFFDFSDAKPANSRRRQTRSGSSWTWQRLLGDHS